MVASGFLSSWVKSHIHLNALNIFSLILFLAFCASGKMASASIAYTGNQCNSETTVSNTVSCTLTVANTGDTVVIFADSGDADFSGTNTATCGTVSLIRSAVWDGTSAEDEALYIPNATAGSCTVSIGVTSGAPSWSTIQAADWSGTSTTAPIDNASCASSPYCDATGSSGTTSTGSSAPITTANANEMVIAHTEFYGSDTVSAVSPYTLITDAVNGNGGMDYDVAASAGSNYASFSSTLSNPWLVMQIALVPAATAPVVYASNQCSSETTVSNAVSCTLAVANTGDTVVIFADSGDAGFSGTNTATCGTVSLIRSAVWDGTSAEDEALYIPNATAGSCTVSIGVTSGAPSWSTIQAADWSGTSTTAPIDNASCASSPYCDATGSGTTSTGSSAPITTANANEMVIAHTEFYGGGTITATSPYTLITDAVNGNGGMSYDAAASAGSNYTSFSNTVSYPWLVMQIALAPASSAAATPTFSPGTGSYTSTQTVTISDSTSGATIYYTTDGTTPTTNSSTYSSAITVSATETLEAIAAASGYSNSTVDSAAYTISSGGGSDLLDISTGGGGAGSYVADEYYSGGATYSTSATINTSNVTNPAPQAVYQAQRWGDFTYTLPGFTVGATYTVHLHFAEIYFGEAEAREENVLINGTQVLTNFDQYAAAGGEYIAVVEQFSAVANSSGQIVIQFVSVVNNASIEGIEIETSSSGAQAATPAFSLTAGAYSSAQTVTISDSTSGATIYYTTNGTTPTTSSSVYSSAITVSATETLEAIATASGYSNSAVGSAAYTIGSSGALTNGYYTIQNLDSSLNLQGGGLGTAKGTGVVQESNNSGANNSQIWGVTSLGGSTYQIIDIGTGLSLDDYADHTTNGSEIDVWTPNQSNGQIWNLTATSGGYYTIASQDMVNAGNTTCIEPSGGSTSAGAEVVIYTCTSTSAEQWEFVPYSGTVGPANGTYEIQSLSSGLVMDGGSSGTGSGTAVFQDSSTGGANQAWAVSSLGSYTGTYQVVAVGSNLALDDFGDATSNGSEIDVYTITSSDTGQIWTMSPTSGGYYAIASQDIATSSTNYDSCIEPSGGSSSSGTDIVIYSCTPTSAEQWEFVPVSNLDAGPTTPTFSPVTGSYNGPTSVAISTATPAATIYYTTNGTTPTTNSAVYGAPISVSASETLKAVATAPNYLLVSSVGSAAYTITFISNEPSFSPAEGTYDEAQTVTISDTTPGVNIYYTTNGTTPTTSSTAYSSPITVSVSQVVEAVAAGGGYTTGEVGYGTYTISNGSAGDCTGLTLGTSSAGTAELNGYVPFPATNPWNVNIANAPVDPNNAMIQAAVGYNGESTHINFGGAGSGGIPYVIVDSTSTPAVPIHVMGGNQSDVVVAPYPANVPIEGFATECSGWPDTYQGDSHALVLDRHTCWLYETYNTNYCNGLYDADNESIWDMTNGNMRPWGWSSADAAGLSVFAGTTRYDEAASGTINHAIRYTSQQTKLDANDGYFVEPATHAAGSYYSSVAVMGMRLRLNSTFDISGYSAINQAILTALQQYGMILADNGGYFYIQGSEDSRWDTADLDNMNGISSSNFTVIQMSPEYPGWDSVTAPTGPAPTINSFTASTTNVTSGNPVIFDFSVTGDSYDYIDMIGPVRLSSGSGSVTINPTATQTYMLYSVNQYGDNGAGVSNDNGTGQGYGVTVSTPITVVVTGSTVVPPTFTPVAGTYTGAQVVTLNTTTYPYATIYYTTDGSTPTTNSTMYPQIPQPMSPLNVGSVASITISTSQTVKAIAVAPGYTSPSSLSSAAYTIN